MKKFFTTVLLAGLVLTTYSTVITVSNDPNSIGMYSSIQDAADAATAGDTILIAATPTTYSGTITIRKQLVLIGGGYTGTFKTVLNNVSLNPLIGDLSGTILTGLSMNRLSVSGTVRNINVTNCRLRSYMSLNSTSQDWVIEKSVLYYISGNSSCSNIVIRNNIFSGTTPFYNFQDPSVIISNNIFLGPIGTNLATFSGVTNAVVTNNILFFLSPEGCDYCTMTNNISYGGSSTAFLYANNSGGNNLEGVDPLFEDVSSPEWNESYDYRLKPTSPGINAGSDGTDIGIYGGTTPYPYSPDNPFPTNPVPGIPLISVMNILNGSLEKTDALRVKVTANANNE